MAAAFGAYFCMYALRKPFNNGTYDSYYLWGLHYKSILIIAQVLGYMTSKFIGIKVISELQATQRTAIILSLIGVGLLGLILFGIVPYPYNFICLFINGLPLGMVWGVIFSYLEGRQFTELIAMGLASSQIMASGVLKTIYFYVQELLPGVTEFWMPAVIGIIFIPAFLFFTWMLARIPPPSPDDISLRKIRVPMTRDEKRAAWKRFHLAMLCIIVVYCFVTTLRDFRDSFSVEIWREISSGFDKTIFAQTEITSGFILFFIMGSLSWIKSNRLGFRVVCGLIYASILISAGSSILYVNQIISPFWWMQLVGFGLFLGYMPLQIVFFDRFIAVFNLKANAGFFVYICDAIGYLGSVFLLFFKDIFAAQLNWSKTLMQATVAHLIISLVLFTAAMIFLAKSSAPHLKHAHHHGAS